MPVSDHHDLIQLLAPVKTIALVGASDKASRPSHRVMAFLQARGFQVWPVNPRLAGSIVLGETVYANLESLPGQPDMVDVFLNPSHLEPVVTQTIAQGIGILWLQKGVIDNDLAGRAEAAGLMVAMDVCPKEVIEVEEANA